MDDDKRNTQKIERLTEGHKPRKKGYQPTTGKIDPKNPPKDGSGLKEDQEGDQTKEKKAN